MFFAKERNVLFRSLEKNGKERSVLSGLISCQKNGKERNVLNGKERGGGAQPCKTYAAATKHHRYKMGALQPVVKYQQELICTQFVD